ncbi:hypothetical protein GCM10023185_06780 [Hymenobacter saemangeumensis]|uniref:Uncharacterized protein n=1 Tax=Hymenobacter saemangeumensis TaxID=1084522 RepID=A0ABP8I201_9BACT
MALNTTRAETAVLALLDDMASRTDNPAQARRDFARQLVATVADLIRSGTVTGTVATTGTAAAQTGTITSATIS